jgi:hypothetical protein
MPAASPTRQKLLRYRTESLQRRKASPLCQITAVSSCNNLLDQLIHAREQRRWNCEAEHPRSFEIDEKLELGRLLDRNVGGAPFKTLSAISAARWNTSYAHGRRAENQSHGGCH